MQHKKKICIAAVLLAVILATLCFVVVRLCGKTYTMEIELMEAPASAADVRIIMDEPHLEEVSRRLSGSTLYVTYRAVGTGGTVLSIEGSGVGSMLYAHKSGILTENTYFGPVRGGWIVHAAAVVYLAFLILVLYGVYRENIRECMYQYRNITFLGILIYLAFLFIRQIRFLIQDASLEQMISNLLGSGVFSLFSLPVVLLVSVFVTISNIQLIRREGRSIRNLLGLILGVVLCFGIIIPVLSSELLQSATWIDVHNMNRPAMYIEVFLEELINTFVTYAECLLIATIICALRAAKHIPAFDKDAIAILGCQIREDGTLTKLLQSRVDRAIDFARMQKEATGKDILFIPSGGKGPDECISEAEAMRNYLRAQGIPEERIAMDDRSADTYENIGFSYKVMQERIPGGKMAFATTNYHVLRAGSYAYRQGIDAEGIGSPTKAYFWINAFIREFVAAFEASLKGHLIVLGGITLLTAGMTVLYYFINNYHF
ncbi:MAG: YdcF family protein [Firmicutes bacterium]|nr:YdcF family protein [Bacillota bacterium]